MIGPLTVTMVRENWAAIHDDSGRRICALYGDNAEADAFVLTEAFNQAPMLRAELAAAKAENARLREMMAKWGMASRGASVGQDAAVSVSQSVKGEG